MTWIEWQYPHESGHNILNGDPKSHLAIYSAATTDSFSDVLKHYEALSGITGLAEQSSGGWDGKSGTTEEVRAFLTSANFTSDGDNKLPNDRFFMVRLPTYSVTAFIRQPPQDPMTRITLVFESK